jgi:hypothetical protein
VDGTAGARSLRELPEKIERDLSEALQGSTFFIHVEPSEDPASFADQSLDRGPLDGRGQK